MFHVIIKENDSNVDGLFYFKFNNFHKTIKFVKKIVPLLGLKYSAIIKQIKEGE